MTPEAYWTALLGEKGPLLRNVLILMFLVSENEIQDALNRLSREESIGCMTNPTAYVDGRRWDNITEVRTVLNDLLKLRKTLSSLRGSAAVQHALGIEP